MALVRARNIGKSDAWITRHHIDTFPAWLRQHLMGNETINQQLAFLARGPFGYRLEALQNDVVQCLVSFELIFPPSFFNIMTHLLCHLVKEI
ncbi:DUF4218 domain-containing protein, partial [Klebsiella pneumoniae]|uniref:DUF4218 domain-containing protein n=1 Tax=Klebsiella pneumoniae TaxID=573 RepID=UPI003B5BB950